MKININDKELMARMLVERMKEKSEKEIRIKYAENDLELKKEAETDCLYYWLLSRLYVDAESRIPARPHAKIIVKGRMSQYNKVLLTQGTQGYESEYLPLYVEGTEFFDVVENTLKIFDGLDDLSANMIQKGESFCEFSVSF